MPIHTWPARSRASAVTRPLDRCRPSSGPGAQVFEAARARVEARDAAAERAHPQLFVDLEQAHDAGGAERGGHRRIVREDFGFQGLRVEAVEAAAHGADPDVAIAAFEHGHDAIVAQTTAHAVHVAHRRHAADGAIEQVDAAAEGADPQAAELVLGERGDVAVGEPFLGAGAEVAERPGARIPFGEAAGLRADPQRAAAILEQRDDVVVGQRARFGFVAVIAREGFGGGVEPRRGRGSGRPTGGPGCR